MVRKPQSELGETRIWRWFQLSSDGFKRFKPLLTAKHTNKQDIQIWQKSMNESSLLSKNWYTKPVNFFNKRLCIECQVQLCGTACVMAAEGQAIGGRRRVGVQGYQWSGPVDPLLCGLWLMVLWRHVLGPRSMALMHTKNGRVCCHSCKV